MPDTGEQTRAELGQRLKSGLTQLGPQRVAIMVLLLIVAAVVAAGSWRVPLLRDAEAALYDLRAATLSPTADPDSRVTLVVYTPDTNRKTGQISPVDRTIMAQALAQIDRMGAKAVGIDVLMDSPQPDDPVLHAVLKGMRIPVFLAFTTNKASPENITWEQEQDLRQTIAAVRGPTVQPASILLDNDGDNVARRWPARKPGMPPLLALAMTQGTPDAAPAFAHYTGPIRFRRPAASDRPVFDELPIDFLADPETAAFAEAQIRGRYVLIGAHFSDFDKFDTPFTRTNTRIMGETQTIGVAIHAAMLAQLLDHALPAKVPLWGKIAAALVAVGLGALTALAGFRTWVLALGVLVQIAALFAFPFLLQKTGFDTLDVPALGWMVGWLLGYLAVSSALRALNAAQREFAQGALGKYLPRSVANEIMRNPERLSLHGEKREIFCLFSDLEGFTKLTHAVEPEMIARLLNDYLDRLSGVVLQYGGTLDKFVGDAVVAFWGAPIAKPDDGERAVRAAVAMYEAGEDFRRNVPEGVPPIGRTRVGLHYGDAIVGNFGGEGRIQYTALGDAMNTAARLEGANKPLDTTVLVSREAMERSGLDWFRPMGTVTLRGRATPVAVFEPVPESDPRSRTLAADLIEAHNSADAARVRAVTERIAVSGIDDPALANLVQRLQNTHEGESYVLG
ncbi:adenylate/guanylate cyclase domain-containing protein [Novosphingobium sp. KCTC 2891]|uniref:adenylate/guanylate cyclase domain-containing protein n=1 Tax=Novosphingobium sp. KCTC 2891 TaxID=2989730 RepID=UPI002222CCE6|nr:adenylate/guanylate cyclase domain-containing protein [Novosphingobium sp. KCTC 2891]MCW1381435.1 adenylate/guanylate cyclase domain-containing protein [Novosphingobium sp. KCTC 2891]